MTNDAMQNFADTPVLFDIVVMFDGSDRNRLKQMRANKGTPGNTGYPYHDNWLKGDIESNLSFSRIRNANSKGYFYWNSNREDSAN